MLIQHIRCILESNRNELVGYVVGVSRIHGVDDTAPAVQLTLPTGCVFVVMINEAVAPTARLPIEAVTPPELIVTVPPLGFELWNVVRPISYQSETRLRPG